MTMSAQTIEAAQSHTVSVGVHEEAPPRDTKVRYPAAAVGRLFIPALLPQEPPSKVFDRIKKITEPWLGSAGVYVSFKPRPAEVIRGEWAGVHRQIGVWVAAHPNVKIIVHHEPEGGEDRLDGATFEAMFRRARNEIKDGWGGACVAYCAMAYQWRPGGRAERAPEHWQRVVADQYLCDVYSGMNRHNGAFPATTILPEHPGYLGWFSAIVLPRLARRGTVEWGLGERGFMAEDDRVRAATIRRESAWLGKVFDRYAAGSPLTGYPPSVYLAWSSPGTEHEPAWVLTGDSAVAMRDLTNAFARHTR
jgi:hypothetical protein